jgi:hypothetical protein
MRIVPKKLDKNSYNGENVKVYDTLVNKIAVLIISLILTEISILWYFLDKSMAWNFEKIGSCVFVNLWIFFIVPALRNSYLLNKDKNPEEWFLMGFKFGASRIAFPILLAPYFGMKYYCTKKK